MLAPSRLKETYRAKVDSRLIRYQAYPAAVVAVPIATDTEIVVAGAGPAVDFWLCGWLATIDNLVADTTLVLTLGYGGAAGANPPAVVVVTTFPITVGGVGGSLGPSEVAEVRYVEAPSLAIS